MIDVNNTVETAIISKEAYQLLDTVAKIGIPIFFALITSLLTWFFTFKTTKKNQEHEIEKLNKSYEQELKKLEKNYENDIRKSKLQIKVKMIEDAMLIVEEYFYATNRLNELYLNISRYELNYTYKELHTKNPLYAQKYQKIGAEYTNQARNMTKVISKFKLSGLNNSQNKLYEFSELIRNLNNKLKVSEIPFLKKEEIEIFLEISKKLKKEFYEELYKDFEMMK